MSRQTRVCRDKTRLLSRQKYACRDKVTFVATNTFLSRQNMSFVATKMILVAAPVRDSQLVGHCMCTTSDTPAAPHTLCIHARRVTSFFLRDARATFHHINSWIMHALRPLRRNSLLGQRNRKNNNRRRRSLEPAHQGIFSSEAEKKNKTRFVSRISG